MVAVPARRPSAGVGTSAASSSASRTAAARSSTSSQRPRRSIVATATRRPDCAASSRPSAPTRRSSTWTSTARRPRRSASRSSDVFRTLQLYLGSPVRQRLQLFNRDLPRLRPGRAAVPRQARGHRRASTCAATQGEMIPLRALVTVERRRRARRSSGTTTSSAPPRSTAARRRAVSSGQAHRGDGGAGARDAARRAWATSGRASPPGAAGGRQTPIIFAPGARSSSSWCSRRSTRASRCRSWSSSSVPLALLGALGLQRRAGSPTTSSARSAWSC